MPQQSPLAPSSADAPIGGSPARFRIIVDDDDRDTVLTLIALLREERHEVRGVYSGNDVLAAVRTSTPMFLSSTLQCPVKAALMSRRR